MSNKSSLQINGQENTKGKYACLSFPCLEIFVSTAADTHLRVGGAVTVQPLVALNTFQPVCGLGRLRVLFTAHQAWNIIFLCRNEYFFIS
jgi:hypothetical protein